MCLSRAVRQLVKGMYHRHLRRGTCSRRVGCPRDTVTRRPLLELVQVSRVATTVVAILSSQQLMVAAFPICTAVRPALVQALVVRRSTEGSRFVAASASGWPRHRTIDVAVDSPVCIAAERASGRVGYAMDRRPAEPGLPGGSGPVPRPSETTHASIVPIPAWSKPGRCPCEPTVVF